MDISINGEKADITLESEKNIGEILAGLEYWLANSDPRYNEGFRLSGLSIDGHVIGADSLEDSFNRDIDSVDSIDITILSLAELVAEALLDSRQAIDEFNGCDFAGKRVFAEKWKTSPAALMISEESPDLYEIILNTFSGVGISVDGLTAIIDERLRELEFPAKELNDMNPVITEIAGRLEELPLDIQTGKDRRAAETVSFFSGIAEKIFRIFKQLKIRGFPVDDIRVAEILVSDYIGEFNDVIKELLQAYEQQDSVLVGDLAEYELAPRLRGLYAALNISSTEAA